MCTALIDFRPPLWEEALEAAVAWAEPLRRRPPAGLPLTRVLRQSSLVRDEAVKLSRPIASRAIPLVRRKTLFKKCRCLRPTHGFIAPVALVYTA
jgi:hypothetical protein